MNTMMEWPNKLLIMVEQPKTIIKRFIHKMGMAKKETKWFKL